MTRPHAAIAGAGLAGRLVAWRLARTGWRGGLFDRAARDDTRAACHVAAAMLAPLAEAATCDAAVHALGRRAMALWPAWLDDLQADSGRTVFHRREGTLVVAHAADRPLLQHFEQLLQRRLPVADFADVHPLDAGGVAALEPALAGRFAEGLHLATDGQLANDQLLDALAVAIDRAGGEWHAGCEVQQVAPGRLHTAGATCHADVAIDTRGVGARAAWPGLRGVRGEVLTVACPGATLHRPVRLMHPRYQLYVAPRPGQQWVVGATELDSEDDGPVTVRSLLELGSALYSLHPAFGEARVLRSVAGLRPALDDHAPALRCRDGVWELNGLYRHGYLCGPALVHDLVEGLRR